jgi:hypothetical protein
MALTAVPNTPAITLQPTGPASAIALNPVWTVCDPTNGNYATATGRDLFTFYLFPAEEFAPAWLATSNYTLGAVVNFGGETDAITATASTTNVVTVTANNTFTVGALVTFTGLTFATWLNGQTLAVTGSSGTAFTVNFSHADYATQAETTAHAENPAGIFIALQASGPGSGGARQPNTPAYWSAYVDADAELYVASAPDACTGRTANIGIIENGAVVSGYNVPAAGTPNNGTVTVEFLVLPSSVFTQANGQIQFQASSNLIYVYVRNL